MSKTVFDSIKEKMHLVLHQALSFLLDLLIMFETLKAILLGRGLQ